MSRTRFVSFVVIAGLLCCIAQSVVAAGPYVVPDGVAAGPTTTTGVQEVVQQWIGSLWSWVSGLVGRVVLT